MGVVKQISTPQTHSHTYHQNSYSPHSVNATPKGYFTNGYTPSPQTPFDFPHNGAQQQQQHAQQPQQQYHGYHNGQKSQSQQNIHSSNHAAQNSHSYISHNHNNN